MLVQGISGDRNSLGYFGYAYYIENTDRLKVVAVDGGGGCIERATELSGDEHVAGHDMGILENGNRHFPSTFLIIDINFIHLK